MIQVTFGGQAIVQTNRAYRVLETSHPPAYYIPQEDIAMEYLSQTANKTTFCEWKGMAVYWDIAVGGNVKRAAAWSYPSPNPSFDEITDHIAFYPSLMDACFINDEKVKAQKGDFYGGWITSKIVGPFKGGDGTWGW